MKTCWFPQGSTWVQTQPSHVWRGLFLYRWSQNIKLFSRIQGITQNLWTSRGSWKPVLHWEENKIRTTSVILTSKCYQWNEGQLLSTTRSQPNHSQKASRQSCRNAGAGPAPCCSLRDGEKERTSCAGQAASLRCQNYANIPQKMFYALMHKVEVLYTSQILKPFLKEPSF